MSIGESSWSREGSIHLAAAPASATPPKKTPPSLSRLTASAIVDMVTSPADFMPSDAQKALAARISHENGKYTPPSEPARLSAFDVIRSYIDAHSSEQTNMAERAAKIVSTYEHSPVSEIEAELRERRNIAAKNPTHLSISLDEVKQLLQPLPSPPKRVKPTKQRQTFFQGWGKKPVEPKPAPAPRPRYKFTFTSQDALSNAAFGEKEPLQAYKTLLGRIGALPYEHGIGRDSDVAQSLQLLARTEPLADPLESALALRSAISDIDQSVNYINAIDELSRGLPPNAEEHPMFKGIEDYRLAHPIVPSYSRRMVRYHGQSNAPFTFTLGRTQPFTDDHKVQERMAAASQSP